MDRAQYRLKLAYYTKLYEQTRVGFPYSHRKIVDADAEAKFRHRYTLASVDKQKLEEKLETLIETFLNTKVSFTEKVFDMTRKEEGTPEEFAASIAQIKQILDIFGQMYNYLFDQRTVYYNTRGIYIKTGNNNELFDTGLFVKRLWGNWKVGDEKQRTDRGLYEPPHYLSVEAWLRPVFKVDKVVSKFMEMYEFRNVSTLLDKHDKSELYPLLPFTRLYMAIAFESLLASYYSSSSSSSLLSVS